MPFIDTHCHIDLVLEKSQCSLETFLERAFSSGIEHIVNIGTNLEDSAQGIARYRQHPNISLSAGLHPCEIKKSLEPFPDERSGQEALQALVQNEAVSALGEVGLDFLDATSEEEKREQIKWFELQVQWAKAYRKPLIIHCRNAFQECFSILCSAALQTPFLFHCFTGDANIAKQALDLGAALSFAGILTFKNAHLLRAAAKIVPLDRMLLETDAPFLAPEPLRGSVNAPQNLILTAKRLAELKGIELHEVEEKTTILAKHIFKI